MRLSKENYVTMSVASDIVRGPRGNKDCRGAALPAAAMRLVAKARGLNFALGIQWLHLDIADCEEGTLAKQKLQVKRETSDSCKVTKAKQNML